MRQLLFVVISIIGGLASFTGFCLALIDWVQDMEEGIYQESHLEAFLETGALVLYTSLAIRFMRNKLNL
ncbi:hypothetical protein [Spirosoma spitsbergense]|uniref:hypothetical protein n=1 Tax=Spirosoma spitsbergense TaxID=431554 RepID=UPI0003A5A8EC|nr:hypothetical protein [Spirosoma spitsbergense]